MTNTPCIYELSEGEPEADRVHWFCSEECRDKWPDAANLVYGGPLAYRATQGERKGEGGARVLGNYTLDKNVD